MHDFNCSNPAEMKIPVLAERARYFKEDTKGVSNMCRAMEELILDERAEENAEVKEEMIVEMLKKGFDFEVIADISKLSVDDVKHIAEKTAVKA